jgi:hypothetical protein
MKWLVLSVAIPLVLFLAACGNGERDNPEATACREVVSSPYGLWSEFLDPEEVIEQVPSLKRHEISLYQNIRNEDIGNEKVAALFREASCSGVEVRAWLTLPEEEGYWPNEKNVDLFQTEALRLADWIRSSGWAIDWIVVDMEPDLQMLTTLIGFFEEANFLGVLRLLFNNRDVGSYQMALDKYAAMVETLHGMGFRVMVVTIPIVLDDILDGDAMIQDVMNIPVDQVPWDEFSFMAYTTTFSRLLQTELSSSLVHSYGRDAVKAYGEKAAIDLGVIGNEGIVEEEGMTDVEEIRAQVGAAKDAGLTRIHAYSLDGIVHMDEQNPWHEAFQAPPTPPGEEPAVSLFRGILQFLDRLL